jgi:glycosyltransferase involved in cell wall biosynthesis
MEIIHAPMQILHVISNIDPSLGGTSTALIALARAQRGAGLHVNVLSTFSTPSEDAAESLRRDGVNVTLIGPTTQPLSRHPHIEPALREQVPRADIVHIHALWEEVQHRAARVARELGKPYVITPHGMLDPWSLRQSKWKKRLYLALRMRSNLDHAAAIHYTSEIERDLSTPLKLRPPTIVEPNGVDLAEFENLPPRGAFRAKHAVVGGDRPMVLFLGRVHPKKGLDLLLPAFAQAAPPRAGLVIAGPAEDDAYAEQLRMKVRTCGLFARTVFTGMLRGRERIEAFVDADLFVLPSYQENFGIAVVEALASGCPVLISDQVNIHREITAGGVGGVVPTEQNALADELKRWLDGENLRRAAGARGPAFVRARYDWNVIARHWAGHYARLPKGATR